MFDSIFTFLKRASEIKGKKISHKVIITIVTLIVVILAILFLSSNTKNSSGLYKNIAWGTGWDEVLDILNRDKAVSDIFENDENSTIIHHIQCPDEDKKINITSILSFDTSRKLNEVGLMITKEDSSQYSDDELIYELCYRFNDLYGDYTEDVLSYIWLTTESEISFTYVSDGFFLLEYADINSAK